MTEPAEGSGGLSAASTFPLSVEKRRVLRLSVVLFLATFLIYWLSGPLRSAFDFQLSQANNIVHGHLDLTAEYSHNLGILERVLYDGKGFCLPVNDPRGEQAAADIENPRFSPDCKHYMQHSLGPALLEVPLAFFFGLTVNQTMVSAFIGALTAVIVFAITRRFTEHRPTQLALTVLALFGTQFYYSASDGSVWHFAHTTAVFFTFGAIYATVVARKPWLAGALVGAAFMCRPTEILAGIFPLVAFSDAWLQNEPGVSLLRRVRLRPLVELALGVAPFVLLTMVINALRFGSPFETGYSYTEQIYQISLHHTYVYGIFDPRYIARHVQVFWEQMPNVATTGPYVWPSWAGMAMWAVSPPLFYGLFIHLRRFRGAAIVVGLAVAAACAFLIAGAFSSGLGLAKFGPESLPLGLDLMPFWLLVAAAITLAIGTRDRLVVACWAAIVALVIINWMFAATGWAQFGYRYGLDFMPFLWFLVVLAVRRVRWHHAVLIGLAVLINLWGVLWIFKFAPMQLFGWTWVSY
jgi:hypothetical protein